MSRHVKHCVSLTGVATLSEYSVERVIVDALAAHAERDPRSQQVLVGPSELGMECTRCLAKKLVGMRKQFDTWWLPTVGTAVHTWIEGALRERCGDRFIVEQRLPVGIVWNRLLSGKCDAFDTETSTVVDFKIVGNASLKAAKDMPKAQYRTQIHLYGRGWELRGQTPSSVAIFHLPRNKPSLADAVWWEVSYSREEALRALARAERIYSDIGQAQSDNKLTEFVVGLERADGCFDCHRYPPLPGEDTPSALPKMGPSDPYLGLA